MQGAVHGERAYAVGSGIVAPAGNHSPHGVRNRPVGRYSAREPRAGVAYVILAAVYDVVAVLQIAHIFARLSVYQARIGGRDHILWLALGEEVLQIPAHRAREFVEAQNVVRHFPDLRPVERLVIRNEHSLLRHVRLRALVVSAHDGLVGALEEAELAVVRKLHGSVPAREVFRQKFDGRLGDDDGSCDVVLHLELF